MRFKPNLITIVVSAALLHTSTVIAQQAEESEQEHKPGIERIIVTAQRIEQSMQDVPVAVSALEGPELENANIGSIEDLALRIPGVSTGRFNPAQPQIYIRGIGSTD